PTARRVLRILDGDAVRGVRRHLWPELELPRAHRLEANQHSRADAECLLHRIRFHVLVEAKIDGGRPGDRLVAVVDVGVDLERRGDDANDDGGRHHQNRNRCEPPTLVKGTPSCHFRYSGRLASYRQMALCCLMVTLVAGTAPGSATSGCAAATS